MALKSEKFMPNLMEVYHLVQKPLCVNWHK